MSTRPSTRPEASTCCPQARQVRFDGDRADHLVIQHDRTGHPQRCRSVNSDHCPPSPTASASGGNGVAWPRGSRSKRASSMAVAIPDRGRDDVVVDRPPPPTISVAPLAVGERDRRGDCWCRRRRRACRCREPAGAVAFDRSNAIRIVAATSSETVLVMTPMPVSFLASDSRGYHVLSGRSQPLRLAMTPFLHDLGEAEEP